KIAVLEVINDPRLFFNMAKCFQEVGDIKDVEQCYAAVIRMRPNDTEARTKLAEVYEADDRVPEALELVNEVIEIRRHEEAIDRARLTGSFPTDGLDNADTFFSNTSKRISSRNKRRQIISEAQKADMRARKTEQTIAKFRRLEYMRPQMESGD